MALLRFRVGVFESPNQAMNRDQLKYGKGDDRLDVEGAVWAFFQVFFRLWSLRAWSFRV